MIDVSKLLMPVTEDAPCGEDLEYDEAFTDLQLISQYKPEQRMGDAIIPAEEPVWRDVETKASALFERTKDLRVAVHLLKALLHTGAYRGAAQGFEVLRALVEERWECVHPQLDPDDDNDPTMRFNILGDLSEPSTVLAWVRKIPLVSVRGIGSFGLKDLALASGEVAPAEGETVPAVALIDGAFTEAPVEDLEPVGAAAMSCAEAIRKIERVLMDRAEGASPPNLTPLRVLFEQAAYAIQSRLAARGEGTFASDSGQEGASQGATGAAPGTGPKRISGDITSREDVIKAIDKICEYYARSEPASPLPLLLGRCRRLVNKDFMGIIRDMAPDGLGQVEVLRGPVEEEDGYS